jgi:hypothetical protein
MYSDADPIGLPLLLRDVLFTVYVIPVRISLYSVNFERSVQLADVSCITTVTKIH